MKNFKPSLYFNKRFGALVECRTENRKTLDGQKFTPCHFVARTDKEMVSFLNELAPSILDQESPQLMGQAQSLLKKFESGPDQEKQEFLRRNIHNQYAKMY